MLNNTENSSLSSHELGMLRENSVVSLATVLYLTEIFLVNNVHS